MLPSTTRLSIHLADPESAEGRHLLRAYFDDIVSRYLAREATAEEIDSAIRNAPSNDLAPPSGLFLVARQESVAVGCAGMRFRPAGTGEVKRVFVAATARRHGIASLLLRQLEVAAHEHRLSRLRLDTRHDLIEARRLYHRHHYREVPAFNDDIYAEHWFEKTLG